MPVHGTVGAGLLRRMTSPQRGYYRAQMVDGDLADRGLADWWNELPQPQRYVSLRWEHLSTWADAFAPRDAHPCTLVVLAGARPVAALPLLRRRGVLHSMASDAHSDVFDAGCDPAFPGGIDALVEALVQHRTDLERLDGASALCVGLRRTAPPMIVDDALSPCMRLPATPEALLAQLSPKFRAGVRRATRVLARLGTVTMHDYRRGDPELSSAFGTLLDLEASSWKGVEGSAIAARPDTLRFYRSLAVDGPVSQWSRVAVLRVNDRTVAAQLDLEGGGGRLGVKMASAADLGRGQSPGTVLLWHVLADCIERGIGRFALGGELYGWKRHWTDCGDERVRVRSWPRTLTGHLAFGAREHVKQAARPLRQHLGDLPRTGGT